MEFIFNIAIETLYLLAYLLAFVVIGGVIINGIEDRSNKNLCGSIGYSGILITGLGTVVHELSHLIFVIITFMRPTEVKLFRPVKGRIDGRLGYVEYAYNKNNWFHKMSLVLVGIAPIIGGTITILISLKLLIPGVYNYLHSGINSIVTNTDMLSKGFIQNQVNLIFDFIMKLFNINNFKTISFWIFLFIVISISSHMSLSKADIDNAKKGVLSVYIALFLINIILNIIGYKFEDILQFYTEINIYIAIFMTLAIMFSIINLVITFFISKIFRKY